MWPGFLETGHPDLPHKWITISFFFFDSGHRSHFWALHIWEHVVSQKQRRFANFAGVGNRSLSTSLLFLDSTGDKLMLLGRIPHLRDPKICIDEALLQEVFAYKDLWTRSFFGAPHHASKNCYRRICIQRLKAPAVLLSVSVWKKIRTYCVVCTPWSELGITAHVYAHRKCLGQLNAKSL